MADTSLDRVSDAGTRIFLRHTAGCTGNVIFGSVGEDFQFFHKRKLDGDSFGLDGLYMWFYLKCVIHLFPLLKTEHLFDLYFYTITLKCKTQGAKFLLNETLK